MERTIIEVKKERDDLKNKIEALVSEFHARNPNTEVHLKLNHHYEEVLPNPQKPPIRLRVGTECEIEIVIA